MNKKKCLLGSFKYSVMSSRVPRLPDPKLKEGCLILNLKALRSFPTSATLCQSTRHNVAEDKNLHRHSSMEFKSLISTIILTGRFKFGCKIRPR